MIKKCHKFVLQIKTSDICIEIEVSHKFHKNYFNMQQIKSCHIFKLLLRVTASAVAAAAATTVVAAPVIIKTTGYAIN